jgi:hypothetical protein
MKTQNNEEIPYLETDMYRSLGKDWEGADVFCYKEQNGEKAYMCMYTKRASIVWVPLPLFNTEKYVPFGTDIEHECHYYRNGILMASGRFFSLVHKILLYQKAKDQFIIPIHDIKEGVESLISYHIESHSWGNLVEYTNVYSKDKQFVKEDEPERYDHKLEQERKNHKMKSIIGQRKPVLPKMLPAPLSRSALPLFSFEDSNPMVRKQLPQVS